MDGDIDYSKYGRAELLDALSSIDRNLWPRNYANLTRELASRPPLADAPAAAPARARGSDALKSGNPALSASTFDGLAASDDPMTLAGTLNKTAMLLALVLAGAGWVWNVYFTSRQLADIGPLVLLGSLAGLALGIVTIFNKRLAGYLAPAYAALEGLAVGGISALYESHHPGIAIQAIGLTFGILLTMLVVYRTGLIKVTARLQAGVVGATGGIALLYLADLVLMYFGHPVTLIHEGGPWGIAFSLFVICIAALNLVMDFDFIAKGVAQRAPKYMEWYAAFGLIVTLVWLYLEILRLLGRRR